MTLGWIFNAVFKASLSTRVDRGSALAILLRIMSSFVLHDVHLGATKAHFQICPMETLEVTSRYRCSKQVIRNNINSRMMRNWILYSSIARLWLDFKTQEGELTSS